MTDLVLAIGVLAAVVLCIALYFRLRRERETISALESTAADMKARARLLADHSRQAIFIFDSRGLIRRVNPAAEKMCGYREAELLGQSFLRLVPQSPAGRGGEAEVRCKDGTRVKRRFTTGQTGNPDAPDVYLFFDEDEPVRGEAASEQKSKTEPRFPSQYQKQSQHPKPGFARDLTPENVIPEDVTAENVAIERTPVEDVVNRIVRAFEGLLTTISGYTELALHATPSASPVRKDLEEVAAASDAASNLARNLLAYSGRQTIPVESIDLNALVGALEDGLRQAMKTPFHVALAKERPTVLANGECLGQIVMILCTSAHHRARHFSDAGRVEIRTEKRRLEEAVPVYSGKVPAGVYSVLSISDSGPAIESATLAHLFEPLFLEREAIGVELAPVHGIVRNLGGWIDVTSQEKRGTTFEVLFPYAGDFLVGKGQSKGSLVG